MSLDVSPSSQRIPAARPSFPVRRRIATYFTGGVDGLLTLSATLQQGGCKVHDLAVDIHDGVAESSMVCTVLIADGGVEPLLERLRTLPAVVSSELL
ncbi:hypothetical protein [Prauserella muralis]|uniref:Uncharacterized protein n=1 Tax=Prauserella muralis TaxID=588067 RepID=A0A2V4B2K6_9PSEU|nr:hypothetical protein [Prauserella muralis]PXY22785.1 hypothetical protein BAY60_23635 [Prauserella muralis]TWE28527.1 hypothetical protein FHX69_1184 [Prauserella muralis]